jgi:hypothetical protein
MTDSKAETPPAKSQKLKQKDSEHATEPRRKTKRKTEELRDASNSSPEPTKKKKMKTGEVLHATAPTTKPKKKKRRAVEALDAPETAPVNGKESEGGSESTAAVLVGGAKEAREKGSSLESPAKKPKAQGAENNADLNQEKKGKKRRRCQSSIPPGPQVHTARTFV